MSKAIGMGLAELTQVTRPRPGQDEAGIEAGVRRLFAALKEYSEDVALWALDAWPRHSEWFPTEHELRVFCDRRMCEIAREEAAKRGEAKGGRFLEPVGKTAYFASRAFVVMGEPWCKSWLAGGITCMFSNDTIYTTSIGCERINRDCDLLLREAGVRVIESKDASKMLADYCDRNQLSFEPKRRRA